MKNQNRSMKITISILFILINIVSGISQNFNGCNYKRPQQADNWVFGDDARINFSNLSTPEQIAGNYYGSGIEEAPVGISSISDENGNLLLYTNGMQIWDASSNIICYGLKGYNASTMTSIIVPNPANANQYYVFSVDLYVIDVFTDGINYTVVEYVNNSYWKIIAKNLPLLTENSQKICAVKHENGTDYWIITHGLGPNKGDKFYVNLLSDTLNVNAQTYKVGTAQTFDPVVFNTYNNGGGYLKSSSDGSKLAHAIFHDGYVEVFDFNNATGEISNAQTSQIGTYMGPFGIEFSPDGSKLYVTTSPLGNLTNFLYQIDLEQANPLEAPFEIARLEMIGAEKVLFGALQLATDGKIYMNKYLKGIYPYPGLGVIYNPNRIEESCNYNKLDGNIDAGINLDYGNSLNGLPNFPSNFVDIPHFFYGNQCLNDTTNFIIRNTANLIPAWEFKDQSGTTDLTNPMAPLHIFSASGTYNVELTETYDGTDYIFSEEIIINPLPSISIGNGLDVIYILPGSSIRLDAGEGMDIYNWNPGGSTGRYMDASNQGIYTVTVTDFNCCTNSDTIEIKYASLSFPNAFKPSSIIPENQKFTVMGNVSAIAKFQFNIFNRWGQLIFETDDPTEGWDGSQDGSPAPVGTYVYAAVFTSFESGIQSSIEIKNTGTVTLVR